MCASRLLYAKAYLLILCAFAYFRSSYGIAHIDKLFAFAYKGDMEQIARNSKQIGATLQRRRKALNMSQAALGEKISLRQATVSKLEAGEPATRIETLMAALGALGLELVIRPRTRMDDPDGTI